MVWKISKRLKKRTILAFLFLVVLALGMMWSFRQDFESKDWELLRGTALKGSYCSYILTLNSFDMDTQEVRGVLRFEGGLPIWDDKKETIFYGPLSYSDLTYYYTISIKIVDQEIRLLRGNILPATKFTKSFPSPINVSIRALGNSQIYPFDRYFIMGAVTCQAYVKKGREREYVHTKEDGEFLSIKNYIKGLFIRYPTNVELDEIRRAVFPLSKEPAPERKEVNNHINRFALVMERPYYLKIMTVVLGAAALMAALYIGFKTPFKDVPIQIIGYVIGVWGIRNILIGDLKIFPSYFDYALLWMYVLLFAGIVFRKIKGVASEKEDVSKIP